MATLATPAKKKGQQVPEEKSERNRLARPRVDEKFKIFSGTANEALADEVCAFLELTRGQAMITRFRDGECYLQIQENVRGADVFVMQSTCRPVDEHLMELLLMIDALKRASARRITAVIPYYGYARQDRKDKPRVPITSKLCADLISAARADRVLTLDLHAVDLTIVSPDAGGVERARAYAKRLGATLAIIDKRRVAANQTEVMNIIGDVEGRNVFVVDDIIDTAGTLIHTTEALLAKGAKSISASCTHAVLSGPAIQRINSSQLGRVIATNSMPTLDKEQECPKLKTLSIAEL